MDLRGDREKQLWVVGPAFVVVVVDPVVDSVVGSPVVFVVTAVVAAVFLQWFVVEKNWYRWCSVYSQSLADLYYWCWCCCKMVELVHSTISFVELPSYLSRIPFSNSLSSSSTSGSLG